MVGRLWLNELTRDEVRDLAPDATVVLPVASTEQHGPHLPLKTDSALAEAVAFRAARAAAESVPVVVAPVLPYGCSHHHLVYCALSLSSGTLIAVLNDLADSLVASGFRRIFFLNSHGGNDEVIKLLAKDLVLRHPIAVAACAYWQVGEAAVKATAAVDLVKSPGHSGAFETAMMMAAAPDLVRTDRIPEKRADLPAFWARGIAPGLMVQKAGEWERIGGYTDEPALATPEKGRLLLEAMSMAVAGAIVAFHRESFR